MSIDHLRASVQSLAKVIGVDPSFTRPEHQHSAKILNSFEDVVTVFDSFEERLAAVEKKLVNIKQPFHVLE